LIRILFLAANPLETDRLQLGREQNDIEEGIRKSTFGRQFDIQSDFATQVKDLQDRLQRSDPNIVHFSGHGQNSRLILEDADGHGVSVPPNALANLFGLINDHDGNIKCVVLNACYSEDQALAIAKYVDCVVGISGAISDKAAAAFAASFYSALAYGQSVKKAFDLGCNSLDLQDIPEGAKPRLNSRAGVDPLTIFLVKGPGASPALRKGKSPKPPKTAPTQEVQDVPSTALPAKPELMQFQPVGRWNVQFSSGIALLVEHYPNGAFQGYATIMGVTHTIAGNWGYNPYNMLIQYQGLIDGLSPLISGMLVQGRRGNSYYGIDDDGTGFVMSLA
jgi:hypothetical protein